MRSAGSDRNSATTEWRTSIAGEYAGGSVRPTAKGTVWRMGTRGRRSLLVRDHAGRRVPLHLPKPSKLPDSDARFDTAARIVRSAASRARWLIRGSVALPLCYMLMLFLDFEERMLSGVRFWVCAVVGFFLLAWLIAGLLSDWPFRWLPAWSDRVASASRRLGRCPSCFADLAGVGADAATGRTTCPQCAAEWKLPTIVRCRSCGFSLAYAKPGGTGPLKCDACGTWNDRAHAKLPQRCPRCLYTLDAATLRIDGSLTCSECGLVVVEGIPVRLHDAQPGVEPGRWFLCRLRS